jgi:uncharacterized protein YcfJ
MKKFIGLSAIASVLALTGCVAVPSYPTAQRAHAAPQYSYQTSHQNSYQANHQECWREAVGPRSYTPEITGAILGGAAGNQFGSGSGRDIATVAGAVLGGSLGHDYKNRYGQQNYRIVCR